MANHEFGLMDTPPMHGVRYDTYEPERYHCICVNDDDIEKRMKDFLILPCYAHSLDIPWDGLCYCGITLIPPHAAQKMRWMVSDTPHLAALTELLDRAVREQKYVIHYGL